MKVNNIVFNGKIFYTKKRTQLENQNLSTEVVDFYGSSIKFHKKTNFSSYMLFLMKHIVEFTKKYNLHDILSGFVKKHFLKTGYIVTGVTCVCTNVQYSLNFLYKNEDLI